MILYEYTHINKLFGKYQTHSDSQDLCWLLDVCPTRSVHYPVHCPKDCPLEVLQLDSLILWLQICPRGDTNRRP